MGAHASAKLIGEKWRARQTCALRGGCAPSHIVVMLTTGSCAASTAVSVHHTASSSGRGCVDRPQERPRIEGWWPRGTNRAQVAQVASMASFLLVEVDKLVLITCMEW